MHSHHQIPREATQTDVHFARGGPTTVPLRVGYEPMEGSSGSFPVSQSVVEDPNADPLSAEQAGEKSPPSFLRKTMALPGDTHSVHHHPYITHERLRRHSFDVSLWEYLSMSLLRQRWILTPLCDARDRTCILMDASQIHFF